ncbi:hypothetical protein HN51_008259 [Arachis hypogaea]|uniref:CDT1 Geminin-binding domain-containing protein n=1 Tax=Arachis hypogaea TaxID=3818 RepID=A0A445D474_ARAHY|nr:CDT1-like protein a, chloroplastic [Arachis hypogaea]QHO42556.1 CDT1-like protein a [Arachis hypogaea]RYR57999.1 hypothetical protein Ahy_A05g023662 [Arachis hypogaea]
MEQKSCEESARSVSDLKCAKNLNESDESIACPTPNKTNEPLPSKSKEQQTQLPEKYRAVADLFGHMSCSLRLLHLRKKSPTFQNICAQVEILAQRKFSYAHLAQMKYILPEGIHIDKVLVHDKKSLCMKSDMKITLVFDFLEEESNESADMALRQYFSSRLINFSNMHPEAADIPEAVLPEPFGQRPCGVIDVDLPVNSSRAFSSTSNQIELLPGKFHLCPSFSRHFSQKNVASQTEKLQCFSTTKASLSSCASDCQDNQESKYAPPSDCATNMKTGGQGKESLSHFQPNIANTPVHTVCPPHDVCDSSFESPDIKISSSSNSLMTETPAQSAPGRLIPISDAKLHNMDTRKSASCRKPAKRVLDFPLMEGNDGFDIKVDNLEPTGGSHKYDSILESSIACAEDWNVLPQQVEERSGHSREDTNQIQGGLDTRDQKSSSLLDLVNVIHSIFHSVRGASITKEEFLQKILMNSLDVVEISEVEEQINFLEKLVPDWICRKLLPSGDDIYSMKKVSDLDSVRSRLLANVTRS